jgi:hypothetical protein
MNFSRRVGACAAVLIAAFVLAVAAVPAEAQTYQGAVRGSVKDSQGIIPGV